MNTKPKHPYQITIVLAGLAYTGKSTTIEILKKIFSPEVFSSGGYMRHLAQQRSMRFEDFLKEAEDNPAIDEEIDGRACEHMVKKDVTLIDARIAHLFPEAQGCMRVLLTCNDKTELHRRYCLRNKRYDRNIEDVWSDIEKRNQRDLERLKKRYPKLHGIDDPYNINHFDLVVNTNDHAHPIATASAILAHIVANYQKKQ